MSQVESVSPLQAVPDRRSPQTGFRQDIEGLRAVAVLAVVLFHAGVPGVSGGFVGVDMFFVISGFLITGLLWREVSTAGTIRLARFYGARARRLLPASATVGVVTMIGAVLWLSPLEARVVMGDGIASALYVGNYRFALQGTDYFAADRPPSPFLHYWSLGVEEQFYLMWPALIIGAAWLMRRKFRRTGVPATASESPYLIVLALVAVVSFLLSLIATRGMASMAFFSLPTRAWQLAVGGLVALTAVQWRRLPARAAVLAGWAGLAVLLLSCARLSTTTPYPGIAALLPVLGAALVIGAGCAAPDRGCGRVLALPPMRAVGRVSYSWYLWHWPVLLLAPPLLGHSLGLAGRLVTVVVSAGLAVLTLRVIENPLRFAAALRRSASASLAVGGVATAVAVCVGVAVLVLVPNPVGRSLAAPVPTFTVAPPTAGETIDGYDAAVQRAFAQVQAAVAASADREGVPSNLAPPLTGAAAEKEQLFGTYCLLRFEKAGEPDCAMGDTASATTVALIGDSNATMWGPGFERTAAQQHWHLEMFSKAACPVLDLPTRNYFTHQAYTECDEWRGQVMGRLQADHPQLIVLGLWRRYGAALGSDANDRVLADFTPYDPAWIDSLTRLVQQLRGTGAEVLVLGPIPDPRYVVPDCLASHLNHASLCAPPKSMAVNEGGIAAEAAATKAGGGHYVDITELFCTAVRCPGMVGNTLVYFDRNHLTFEYSRLLAPVLGILADRALAGG